MDIINKIKPAVPKRALFFVASPVWGFASYRILIIGLTDLLNSTKLYWIYLIISLIGYYFFFRFVFLKMYLKHTRRIINAKSEHLCIFSFFDLKSFGIMAFMITFGITLRKSNIIPSVYLGTFYISLGLSLLSAAISFIYSGIRYENAKNKHYLENKQQN